MNPYDDEMAVWYNELQDHKSFSQFEAGKVATGPNLEAADLDFTPPKYTEDQLKLHPDWIEGSKRMHLVMEGEPFRGSDKDAAIYGLDLMSEFNWNMTGIAGIPGESGVSSPGMGMQILNIINSNGAENNASDFLFLLNMYADTKTEGPTIKRSFRALVGAPETWASLGGGLLAPFIKMGARKTGSQSARKALMMAAKTAAFPTKLSAKAPLRTGAGAGAGYSGGFEAGQLGLEQAAGADISPEEAALRMGISTLAGAVGGAGLTKTGQMLAEDFGPSIREGLANLGQSGEKRLFTPPTAENPVAVVPPTETEPGIIAFHGSGADFDQFTLEKIGTGEGNQAYGYGLYFTDSEDIAKFYRDAVGGKNINRIKQFDDIGQALKGKMTLTTDIVNNIIDKKIKVSSLPKEAQSSVKEILKRKEPPTIKKMYKVGLAPKPEDMIDYQTTFADQPQKVQDALKAIGYDTSRKFNVEETGNGRYSVISVDDKGQEARKDFAAEVAGKSAKQQAEEYAKKQTELAMRRPMPMVLDSLKGKIIGDVREGVQAPDRPDKILSEKLLEQGIPGIKYRAAGSRAANIDAADAEMNYVIFDDKAIKILEKYGIVGPVAVTAIAGAQQQKESQGEIM
jgi:hypothetical protein